MTIANYMLINHFKTASIHISTAFILLLLRFLLLMELLFNLFDCLLAILFEAILLIRNQQMTELTQK